MLKEHLPIAYLPWAIASETAKHLAEFDRLRNEINEMLSSCGVDKSFHTPMKRTRSASTSSSDESDSEQERSPVTPATSVFSPSSCSTPRCRSPSNPQSFLLAIPPAHSIPFAKRNGYSAQLARLSKIASRLSAIKKLQGRYDREEGKRRWTESLERGRQGDRSLRRAYSNGDIAARVNINSVPVKRSGLWRSWTADDQQRYQADETSSTHPAMLPLSPVVEAVPLEDNYIIEFAEAPRRRSVSHINLPNLPDLSLEDNTEDVLEKVIIVHHPAPTARRPSLEHRDAVDDVPSLVASRSDESLAESEDWDQEKERVDDELLAPSPAFAGWEANVVRMSRPELKSVEWTAEERDPDVRVEVYGSVEVVYA
jgi:hypothetical protein